MNPNVLWPAVSTVGQILDLAQVSAVCDAAMREYGVPERIRTDNGTPFAGTGLLGLSKLSLGWTKLGIVRERIQPGKSRASSLMATRKNKPWK